MYVVSITAPKSAAAPTRRADLQEAVDALRDGLIGVLDPGVRVMWTVRCPSGRVVRGDITVHAVDADPVTAVAGHLQYVRDALTADTRAGTAPAPHHRDR